MKILITYYSMTGNTEAVARVILGALAGEEVTLKKIDEVDPATMKANDLLILGSGIYAGSFHKSVKKFLKGAQELPPKVALFYTHATADPKVYQPFPRRIRKILEKKGCTICAEFECLGETKNVTEEQLQQRLEALSPEEIKREEAQIAKLKGHPNAEDLQNAQKFAKDLL